MNILQRYIFFKYLRFLIGLVFLFIALFVMVKFTEQINLFIEISDKTPLRDYFFFFLYEIPFSLTFLFPMASMFSLVYTLGKLNEESELVVFYTSGKSIWFYVLPILFFKLGISLFFFLNEKNFFYHNHYQHMSLYRKFQNREFPIQENRNNLVQFGKDNKIYLADRYNVKKKEFDVANLVYLDKDLSFKNLLSTKKITFKEGTKWELENYINKEIKKKKIIYLGKKKEIVDLGDKPVNFEKIIHPAKDISATESRAIAEKLEIIGGNHNKWWTEYHRKNSFYFVSVVMFFFGVSLSTFFKNSILVLSFTYVTILAFLYFFLFNVGASLGQIKLLPPLLAGWFGNIVFLVLSVFLYFKLRV